MIRTGPSAISHHILQRGARHQQGTVDTVTGSTGAVPVLLREGFRRFDMLPSFAIQRVKKRHEIALLFVRQLERNDQWILVRVLHASLIVEVHDLFQSFEAAVMRIRCASGDLPQGRGLDRKSVV